MCKQFLGFVAVAGFTGFLGDGARAESPEVDTARIWLVQAAAPEGGGGGTAGSNKQPEEKSENKNAISGDHTRALASWEAWALWAPLGRSPSV